MAASYRRSRRFKQSNSKASGLPASFAPIIASGVIVGSYQTQHYCFSHIQLGWCLRASVSDWTAPSALVLCSAPPYRRHAPVSEVGARGGLVSFFALFLESRSASIRVRPRDGVLGRTAQVFESPSPQFVAWKVFGPWDAAYRKWRHRYWTRAGKTNANASPGV
jgi:hypothetical protein